MESAAVDRLAEEIIEKRKASLREKTKAYPRAYPYLSDISECERQMVYGVTDWQSRALPDEDLQARFEAGNLQEREIVRELQGLGYKVTLSQMPVEVKGRGGILLARGRIDGFIEWENGGTRWHFPIEIKSMNPNIFQGIKSLDDFQKKPHLRKYVRQLQMYMFGNNVEQGLFILTDCLGHWKLIPIYLDLGECEQIMQRLERVYAHLQTKTQPDRIVYDRELCGKCPFAAVCLQDVIGQEPQMIDNPALESDIDRHELLYPMHSEFNQLHKKLTGVFDRVEKAIVGTKYMVLRLPTNRKAYGELTEEVKEAVKEKNAEIDKIKEPFKKPSYELVIKLLDGKAKEL